MSLTVGGGFAGVGAVSGALINQIMKTGIKTAIPLLVNTLPEQ